MLDVLRILIKAKDVRERNVIDDFGRCQPIHLLLKNVAQAFFGSAVAVSGTGQGETPQSLVTDLAERKMLLYMLVCHIATLKERGNAIVGTITSAAEGKVNVSVTPLVNANWYQSTACGALYWQATAKYRRGIRYVKYCPC